MSERFVRAWSIDSTALDELVGSKGTAKAVLSSSKKTAPAVFATLGRGDKKRGEALTIEALTEVLSGTLVKEHAHRYARMTELCLSHAGTLLEGEIQLGLTNYLPNRADPRWNPVLKALGLRKLAAVWHTPNMSFPWPKKSAPPSEWPIRTRVAAKQLPALAQELDALEVKTVRALPAEALVRADQAQWLRATQDELWLGLRQVHAWVVAVKRSHELVLIIDGDQ